MLELDQIVELNLQLQEQIQAKKEKVIDGIIFMQMTKIKIENILKQD